MVPAPTNLGNIYNFLPQSPVGLDADCPPAGPGLRYGATLLSPPDFTSFQESLDKEAVPESSVLHIRTASDKKHTCPPSSLGSRTWRA